MPNIVWWRDALELTFGRLRNHKPLACSGKVQFCHCSPPTSCACLPRAIRVSFGNCAGAHQRAGHSAMFTICSKRTTPHRAAYTIVASHGTLRSTQLLLKKTRASYLRRQGYYRKFFRAQRFKSSSFHLSRRPLKDAARSMPGCTTFPRTCPRNGLFSPAGVPCPNLLLP